MALIREPTPEKIAPRYSLTGVVPSTGGEGYGVTSITLLSTITPPLDLLALNQSPRAAIVSLININFSFGFKLVTSSHGTTVGLTDDYLKGIIPMSSPYHIPFNKPAFLGPEMEAMSLAVQSGHLSGDGVYTKRCHAMLEQITGAAKVCCDHLLHACAGDDCLTVECAARG